MIDHLGKPPLGTGEMGDWADALGAAAAHANVAAKISGLNTMLASPDWDAGDLREAVAVAVDRFGPEPPGVRQRLAGGAPERRLREGVARDRAASSRTSRRPTPSSCSREPRFALYDLDRVPRRDARRRRMTALTDQAIAEIKDLIMSGEFAAGSKLPKEQDLAQRLGLSRNSLREAVRALTLIGVLEPRVGDGTYVTSLEPELLLTGMGFVSDLLTGTTLLELHQVRRILEPVATGMAATRLDEDDFAALEACLAEMDAAETTQAFIAADEEFHRIIVAGLGQLDARVADPEPLRRDAASPPLALGQRAGRDRDDEAAPLGHLPRAARPRRRARQRRRPDPPLRGRAVAPAADRERGRARRPRRPPPARDPRVTAVYYEGEGRFAIGESERLPPGPGEVRLDVAYCGVCGTDLHIAHGHMDGRVGAHRVIGHEMSGTVAELGPGVDGLEPGDAVVVRPLDTRGETAADKGFSHISRNLKFMGIDTPRRVPAVVDRAGVHDPQAAARPRSAPGGAGRAAGGRLPRHPPRRGRGRRLRRRDRRRADRPAHRPRRPLARSSTSC